LVDKNEGKRPLRRTWCSWEDNIRINLGGMYWDDVDWRNLAEYRDQ
jgi:hypothetical protein